MDKKSVQENFEEDLLSAVERFKNSEASKDDLNIIGRALASKQIEIAPTEKSKIIGEAKGVSFGESNEIRVSGSVIGTQVISGFTADDVIKILKYKDKKEDRYLKIIFAIVGIIAIIAAGYLGISELRKVIQIPIEIANEDYQNASMQYDLVIKNNSEKQQLLRKIGVISHVDGIFGCTAGGYALISSADYSVRFHISEEKTIQKIEPPLIIPPNDFVRFTASLIPDDGGACGDWSSEISLIVENASGASVRTGAQTIKSSDLNNLRLTNYSHEELLTIARASSDAISRAGAINQLSGNDIFRSETTMLADLSETEKNILYDLFLESVDDESPIVRRAAISALASLGNNDAVPEIILIFQSDEESTVRATAARSLGKLRDERAVDSLGFALLNDPINDIQFSAANALGNIGDKEAESYLIEAWNDKTASNVVSVIATSLVEIQSKEAIPLLIAELREEGSYGDREMIISSLFNGNQSYISSFVPTLIDLLLHDSNERLRYLVAYFFPQIQNNQEIVSALGQSAMEDDSTEVRKTAVESLKHIGSSSAIEELENIAYSSQDEEIILAAENALQALGQR